MKGLTLHQCNCDYLATKVDELQDLADREGADVLVIQETKLGTRDQTPRLKGYNQVRKDRRGSGTVHHRGGGLMIYVKEGIPHWEEQMETGSLMEAQVLCIPLSRTREIKIVNLYIPPDRHPRATERWEHVMRELGKLPRGENTIWCGDVNAHHHVWDPHMAEDQRGKDLEEWLCDESWITINDGSATRY
jgi:exonuclease III